MGSVVKVQVLVHMNLQEIGVVRILVYSLMPLKERLLLKMEFLELFRESWILVVSKFLTIFEEFNVLNR